MLRSSENCIVIVARPSVDTEVVVSIPAMVGDCLSNGVGTARAIGSGLTTNNYCPVGPLCTAADGVTIASFCSCKVSTTLTNWPGHRALSVLGNSALSLIVPVVASAALSTNDSLPATGGCAELAKLAATLSSPAA